MGLFSFARKWAFILSVFTGPAIAEAAPGHAAEEPAAVDLELVLAVDVSRSMDFDEQRLQRDGYIAALRHPEVLAAIGSGAHGRIAITYIEWAGPTYQSVVVPWMVLSGPSEAEVFVAKLAAAPFMHETATSISSSLLFASRQFASSGVDSPRRTIDVSGDGANNTGLPVTPVRDRLVEDGITINGLPIMLKRSYGFGAFSIPDLDIYYEDCVIGGPGAFVITVDDPARFEVAIRRKLVLEIAGLQPRLMKAAETLRPPRVDCMIGEKTRGRWFPPDQK